MDQLAQLLAKLVIENESLRALETLSTLISISSNILSQPECAAKRSLRRMNSKVQRCIDEVKYCPDIMAMTGFIVIAKDYQQHYFLPDGFETSKVQHLYDTSLEYQFQLQVKIEAAKNEPSRKEKGLPSTRLLLDEIEMERLRLLIKDDHLKRKDTRKMLAVKKELLCRDKALLAPE